MYKCTLGFFLFFFTDGNSCLRNLCPFENIYVNQTGEKDISDTRQCRKLQAKRKVHHYQGRHMMLLSLARLIILQCETEGKCSGKWHKKCETIKPKFQIKRRASQF